MKIWKFGIVAAIAIFAYREFEQTHQEGDQSFSSMGSKTGATQIPSTEPLEVSSSVTAQKSQGSGNEKNRATHAADEFVKFKNALVEFHRCLEDEDCEYVKSDPRSYSFAVYRAAANEIRKFHSFAQLGESDKTQMAELMRNWMISEDGFVQSAVLDQLANLPTSPENFGAIVEGLKNNYADPLIMEKGLQELRRYLGTAQESQMISFVSETLRSGPQFSSEQAASSVRGLLTRENWHSFEQVYKSLKMGAVKQSLGQSLENYTQAVTGG